ncbi:MAG: (2Fe-2S)-binding protein, partial [Bacteroidota bacterium]
EQQADSLARYMAGDLMATYQGSVSMNILKFEQLDLCSIGQVRIPPGEEDYEQVILLDEAQRFYKKCIFYQGRMVGAILLGDKAEFAEFKQLIAERIELGDRRLAILRGESKAEPVSGPLVCSCAGVGRGNLEARIAEGTTDFHELCKATGAGLGCGSCKPEVRTVLEEAKVKA